MVMSLLLLLSIYFYVLLRLTKGHFSNVATISWQIGWPYLTGTTELIVSAIAKINRGLFYYLSLDAFAHHCTKASAERVDVILCDIYACCFSPRPDMFFRFSILWVNVPSEPINQISFSLTCSLSYLLVVCDQQQRQQTQTFRGGHTVTEAQRRFDYKLRVTRSQVVQGLHWKVKAISANKKSMQIHMPWETHSISVRVNKTWCTL